MKNFLRRIHIKKTLKVAALAIAAAVSLLLIFLAFLPNLISSRFIQTRIQGILAGSMKRQVSWSDLAMTWSDGLTLSRFKLGDGSAPLISTDIDHIIFAPSIGRGADGRLGIDLTVKISNVRAQLAPGPTKPPPRSAKDPLTILAESIQKIQQLDISLPVDVRVMVEATPLNVVYIDPGKELRLDDFSFSLAMPSLATKPLTADVKGKVVVNGREIGKVRLSAKVSDLVTKARHIRIAPALFDVAVSAPGTNLTLSGGLSQAGGFVAQLNIDLPRLLAVAQPFMPSNLPDVDGLLELSLHAAIDEKRDLLTRLTIDGTKLAASGGLLKTRRFGPLGFNIKQQIVTDHVQQKVNFPGGSFTVPELIDVAWSASVITPALPGRSVDASVGPLRVDIARAFSLAAPFLASGTPVRDLNGDISLRSLSLHLVGPSNNGDVALAGLAIKLPYLHVALKKGALIGDDVNLLIEKIACPLNARLPTQLTADLLWSVKQLELSGRQPLSLRGARGTAGLTINNLDLKSASPRKVAASATVKQTVDLELVTLGNQLSIGNIHEQLLLQANANKLGAIEISVPDFRITAASLKSTHAGKRFGPIPFACAVSAADFRLPPEKGASPALSKATVTVSAGDFMKLTADAALSSVATSSGTARVDLGQAMNVAAPFVPSGLKADGAVSASWKIAMPLQQNSGAKGKHLLRSVKDTLAQFDGLEAALKVDNVSATLPTAKGAISLSGLRTAPAVRIVSAAKGDSILFDGAVLFSSLSGLSGNAGKLSPQHGSLKINALLSGWKELSFNEEFRLEPLSVFQEAELTASRIDALLDEKQPFAPAVLLKRLDASLFASVDGSFSRQLSDALPGVDLSGSASGATRVDLAAGRDIALRFSMKAADFGVQLANGTKVEGLHANTVINRVYALAATRPEHWTPLSTALVRPAPVPAANPGAVEVTGRVNSDLRGDVNGARSFKIHRITVKTPAAPLELSDLEGDLLFTQEQAGISYFQGNLLGGTLLTRGIVDLRPEVPTIDTTSSFSNLDVSLLLPKDARTHATGQNAEITGELSFSSPLTVEQRELFEQLRLAITVRKIGADTLERALFSLDPYERNEKMVAQRKMLRMGSLKSLRANAVDGAFSMSGEAVIKGVPLELPKVERMRISELPQRQELTKNRKGIAALRNFLDLMRADTLVIGPEGKLTLKRGAYVQ